MNKYLFLLVTLWSAVLFRAAGQTALTATATETEVGQTWQLTIGLDHAGETDLTAFQLDIDIPEGFSFNEASLQAGSGLGDHDLSAAVVGDGQKLRIVGFSLTNAPLRGESSPLLSLSLKADRSLAVGTYEGSVTDIILSRRDFSEITLPSTRFSLQCTAEAVPIYTLTYLVGEEVFATQTYRAGDAVEAPAAQPAQEDYSFAGWDGLPATMPAQDVTVRAQFTPAWEMGLEGVWYLRQGAIDQFLCADASLHGDHAYLGADTPVAIRVEATAEGYTFRLEGDSKYLGLQQGATFFAFGSEAATFRFFPDNAQLADGKGQNHLVKVNGAYLAPQQDMATAVSYLATGTSATAWNLLTEAEFDQVKPKLYTLTYLVGEEVFATQTYRAGDAVEAPAAQPAQEDYSFAGWDGLPATMPAQDVTVRAQFTPAWEMGLEGVWYLRMDALSQYLCHAPLVHSDLAFVGTDSPVPVRLEATAEGYRVRLEGQNEYLGLSDGKTFFTFENAPATFRFFAHNELPAEGSVRSFFVKVNGEYLSTQGDGESLTDFLALSTEPASWSLLSEEDYNLLTSTTRTAATGAAQGTPRLFDLSGRRLTKRPARGLYLENGQKRMVR